MTKRILVATMAMTALVGLALLASGSLSGSWTSELTFDPGGSFFEFVRSLESRLVVDYTVSGFTATSTSEFQLFGFIWQEFEVTGTLGAFGVQANVLFGPSTADYLYTQFIGSLSIGGVDLGLYFAQLSEDVLGGAADGFAIRLAGSVGSIDVVSITELGARIKDDDFDGITIVHAASGLERSFITDPVVVGQGFTGEKVTVSGWGFGCVDDIATTLYITCAGFESITFDVTGIDTGLSWLTLDVELTFQTQTKSLVLTPTVVLCETLCIDVYAEVLTDAPVGTGTTNTLFDGYSSITGIGLYGLGFSFSWNGVTVKELTVLDTARYAITTEEYGSVIEEITEALDNGHEYYPDYWELFSIEVTGDGCCGGEYTFLANTYFDKSSNSLFDWGMTYMAARIPIGPGFFFSFEMKVEPGSVDYIGFCFEVSW